MCFHDKLGGSLRRTDRGAGHSRLQQTRHHQIRALSNYIISTISLLEKLHVRSKYARFLNARDSCDGQLLHLRVLAFVSLSVSRRARQCTKYFECGYIVYKTISFASTASKWCLHHHTKIGQPAKSSSKLGFGALDAFSWLLPILLCMNITPNGIFFA